MSVASDTGDHVLWWLMVDMFISCCGQHWISLCGAVVATNTGDNMLVG